MDYVPFEAQTPHAVDAPFKNVRQSEQKKHCIMPVIAEPASRAILSSQNINHPLPRFVEVGDCRHEEPELQSRSTVSFHRRLAAFLSSLPITRITRTLRTVPHALPLLATDGRVMSRPPSGYRTIVTTSPHGRQPIAHRERRCAGGGEAVTKINSRRQQHAPTEQAFHSAQTRARNLSMPLAPLADAAVPALS